jgi:hypothetical protein
MMKRGHDGGGSYMMDLIPVFAAAGDIEVCDARIRVG